MQQATAASLDAEEATRRVMEASLAAVVEMLRVMAASQVDEAAMHRATEVSPAVVAETRVVMAASPDAGAAICRCLPSLAPLRPATTR